MRTRPRARHPYGKREVGVLYPQWNERGNGEGLVKHWRSTGEILVKYGFSKN